MKENKVPMEQKLSANEALKAVQVINKQEAEKVAQKFECIVSQSWFSVPKEVFDVCSPSASLLYGHLLGFSSGIYRGSTSALASVMNCSTRNIIRYLNELREKGCIRVVVVSRSRRLIYPVYTLPFILDNEPVDSYSKTKREKLDSKLDSNGFQGFQKL